MIVAVNGMVDFKSFARDGSCASPSQSRIKDKKKENNNKKKKFGGGGFKPAIDQGKGKSKGKEKNPDQVQVVLSMVDYIIQENV